jgi:hypothetical protein
MEQIIAEAAIWAQSLRASGDFEEGDELVMNA